MAWGSVIRHKIYLFLFKGCAWIGKMVREGKVFAKWEVEGWRKRKSPRNSAGAF